jgi:hypothetical protein
VAEDGGPDPLPSRAHPISNRDHLHGGSIFHERKAEVPSPSGHPPIPLPTGAGRLPVHFPRAESDRLERHGRSRAVVSSDAQSLIGSLSMSGGRGQANRPVRADRTGRDLPASLRAPPATRTPNFHALNMAPLPDWARGAWSGYRESDPGLHHGKVMRCHYATAAWSLSGELNPDSLPTKEECCRYH